MSKNIKTLENFIAFLATASGRDKSCRFFQYFGKFVKAFFLNLATKNKNSNYKEFADKADFIGSSMSMTRKVLRIGRPIGITLNMLKMLRVYGQKESAKEKYDKTKNGAYVLFKILSDICLALFFIFDHILYLSRINIIKDEALRIQADYLSNLFWLGECIFTIFHDCIEISILKAQSKSESIKAKNVSNGEQINEIPTKIHGCIVDIIRACFDIPIAIHFMNEKFLFPGLIGIFGVITSCIGCWQSWPS